MGTLICLDDIYSWRPELDDRKCCWDERGKKKNASHGTSFFVPPVLWTKTKLFRDPMWIVKQKPETRKIFVVAKFPSMFRNFSGGPGATDLNLERAWNVEHSRSTPRLLCGTNLCTRISQLPSKSTQQKAKDVAKKEIAIVEKENGTKLAPRVPCSKPFPQARFMLV